MKDRASRILLVVAPTSMECYRTVQHFGLDLDQHAAEMRFISRPYSLIGWSRSTPFITFDRQHWSSDAGVALDKLLWTFTQSGQLRIAGERDLAPLRSAAHLVKPYPPIKPTWRMSQDVQG
ncbi:hypothetical protein [Ensifer adhaerens]|jgi:hypothetical protein|uniref:hypothetical protein n=1 Tax=Ensifer adhaerens TaxID=106592 RepID=UPI00202DE2DC|nr:hypothetical protein [Ensifer adhaerens]